MLAGEPLILNMPETLPSKLSSAALAVLTTRPACHPSLTSCLSSHGESLLYVPNAYGQSLEALPSQPATSGSESHVPGAVSKSEYLATVVVFDRHELGLDAYTCSRVSKLIMTA
ncbi:hypothetical protein Tco_1468576 [Tanacetum coccineum]